MSSKWCLGQNFTEPFGETKKGSAEIELSKGSIYVLRGPRRVGKTAYTKDLITELIVKGVNPDNILYLSSDFFVSRRELRNAIAYFMDKKGDMHENLAIFLEQHTCCDFLISGHD